MPEAQRTQVIESITWVISKAGLFQKAGQTKKQAGSRGTSRYPNFKIWTSDGSNYFNVKPACKI